ncbi:hypothetical protein ACP4OV_006564 [Aristida adscensionis]
MEFFPDLHHVRLRSRVHGTYLHADESGVGVSLRPRGARASLNAAWLVRRILRDGTTCFLLQSAAYGRYLVATPWEAPPGHRGFLVDVHDHDEAEADPFVWKAVGAAAGNDVLVRHISNRLLRANGRYRFWHTGVTVDDHANRSTMMHWIVEAIPRRAEPLPLPGPIHDEHNIGAFGRLLRFRRAVAPLNQRTIRYLIELEKPAIADRARKTCNNFNENSWDEFEFQGWSFFNLRIEVAQRIDEVAFFFAMVMCVRAGIHGGLIPLTVDLPRSTEPMEIVIVTIGTQTAEELLHPDIHAP